MSKKTSTIVVPPAGSISRPLGNLEVFFKTLANLGAPLGHEHWTVHLALRLRFVGSSSSSDNSTVNIDPEQCLRRAWQVVRLQIPAIGSTISSSAPETSGFAVPGEDEAYAGRERLTLVPFDADAWTKDTFVVHRGQKGDDASTLFSSLGPASTAMCYWLPESSEILIRSSHWRLDGIGLTTLAHSYMTALAEVLRLGPDAESLDAYTEKLSATPRSLPPCLENLARQVRLRNEKSGEDGNKDTKGSSDPRLDAGADALVAEFLRGVPSIGLPTRPDSENAFPGFSARSSSRLDAATTARVTAARKAKQFSFTGAVHAAIVRVTAGFPQHPLAKSYAGFFPVNLRQAIAPTGAATEMELVFGLYFSGLPVCVDGMVPVPGGDGGDTKKSFEDVAREMTAVYGRDLTHFWTAPDGQVVGLLDLAEPYLKRTTALFNAPVPESLPPVQTPDLSGLGRVETYLQREYESGSGDSKVQVEDMWIGTEMLNRSIQFHVWSWRDELNIAACFNQSFYDQSFIAEVLNKIMVELQTGLGLQN